MATLADKIRASRIKKIKVGDFSFLIRRPTHAEASAMGEVRLIDVCVEHLVGWEGVTEADVIESGSTDSVPFDKDVAKEWLSDKPDLWNPISNAVIENYQSHVAKVQESVKK